MLRLRERVLVGGPYLPETPVSATRSNVYSFAVAAGAIGAAALLNRACPAPCASCTSCMATIVPMGTAAGAVGVALVGSAVARARGDRREVRGGSSEDR